MHASTCKTCRGLPIAGQMSCFAGDLAPGVAPTAPAGHQQHHRHAGRGRGRWVALNTAPDDSADEREALQWLARLQLLVRTQAGLGARRRWRRRWRRRRRHDRWRARARWRRRRRFGRPARLISNRPGGAGGGGVTSPGGDAGGSGATGASGGEGGAGASDTSVSSRSGTGTGTKVLSSRVWIKAQPTAARTGNRSPARLGRARAARPQRARPAQRPRAREQRPRAREQRPRVRWAASEVCSRLANSLSSRSEMSSIIPPRPNRARRPVMW